MLGKIFELLLGGTGVANAITNGIKWSAIVAALPLGYAWYQGHAGDQIVCLNVAQSLLLTGIIFAIVQVAHGARGPFTPRGD